MRKENKRIRKEPDAVKKALHEYCKEVVKRSKPACIILYGSRAKGTFTGASDFDIIVISSNFEQDFLSRIKDHFNSLKKRLNELERMGALQGQCFVAYSCQGVGVRWESVTLLPLP